MSFFGLFGCTDNLSELKPRSVSEYITNRNESSLFPLKYLPEEKEEGEINDEIENDVYENVHKLFNYYSSSFRSNNSLKTVSQSNNLCIICQTDVFKYKCPKCDTRTCSLKCVNKHKIIYSCDGKKIPVYLKMEEFDDQSFFSDYLFLENCSQYIDSIKRDRREIIRSAIELPAWLRKLKYEAKIRGTHLILLPAGFTKRIKNSTCFMYSTKEIHWTLELKFTHILQKGNIIRKTYSIILNRVIENKTLNSIIDGIINPEDVFINSNTYSKLKLYSQKDKEILVFLEQNKKQIEVDSSLKLVDILRSKTIIEYPTFILTLKIPSNNRLMSNDENKEEN